MAFGDMLVQLRVPEKPAASQLTDQAYIDTVTAAVDTHLTTIGIKDDIPSWANRIDLPDSDAGAIAFVDARLTEAGINTSLYAFTLSDKTDPEPIVIYCLLNNLLRCYAEVTVVPKISSTPNGFSVTVPIDQGLNVVVEIRFVVRPLLTFPT